MTRKSQGNTVQTYGNIDNIDSDGFGDWMVELMHKDNYSVAN